MRKIQIIHPTVFSTYNYNIKIKTYIQKHVLLYLSIYLFHVFVVWQTFQISIQDDKSIQQIEQTQQPAQDIPSDTKLKSTLDHKQALDGKVKEQPKENVSKEKAKDIRKYVTIQSVDGEEVEDIEISQTSTASKVCKNLTYRIVNFFLL